MAVSSRIPRLRLASCAGFTWLEMLIVIAVVGLLAMFAIPGLQETALRKQVKEAPALASVATLGVQVVPGEARVPIAWICAATAVPTGMEVAGAHRTDVPASWLPVECRGNVK